MKKKTLKAISVVSIILCIIMSLTTVFADEFKAEDFNGLGGTTDLSKVQSAGQTIAQVIRNVGILIAVVMLMIIGIKYLVGSAEQKAEYKKTMIPYIVGAVLIFAASTIASAVITMANNI